jgi:hypothetical protein
VAQSHSESRTAGSAAGLPASPARENLIVKGRKIEALDETPHQARAVVRWQQTLKIDHIPAQLTPIRPHHPSFRHRRFPKSATQNHSPSESANSFTRSQAGMTSAPTYRALI